MPPLRATGTPDDYHHGMTTGECLANSMILNVETHWLPRLERLASHLEMETHPAAKEARDIYRNLKEHIHSALDDLTDRD
jgi:hypothetical protein